MDGYEKSCPEPDCGINVHSFHYMQKRNSESN